MIDLTPYGFSCQFPYHGRITKRREAGARLLFLFNERHTGYEMKRLKLLNACKLCELGVVGFIGVEGVLPDWNQRGSEEACADLVHHHGALEGVIEHFYKVLPNNSFANVLGHVFPSITIRSVEDCELYQKTRELYNRCKAKSFDEISAHQGEDEFDNHPLNLERDKVFIKKLFAYWEDAGVSKAAILNAGRSHQDRIVVQLPEDVRYIQMETEAEQA